MADTCIGASVSDSRSRTLGQVAGGTSVARYRSNGPGGGNGRFAVSLAPKLLVRYRPERPMKRTSVAWPVDREADSRTPPSWAFKLTHHRGATPAPYVRAPDFATLPYR